MIDHFGEQVKGSYEHAVFRYGGGSQAGFGPTINSDSGATVTVRRSEISQSGGSGARAYNASNLTLVENEIYDHRDTCIEIATTTGSVLIENNRIQSCPSGVLINKGSPTIRGNFFTETTFGVDIVTNNTDQPVISPHNRFVSAEQTGIRSRYPMATCIDARHNWWGDVSGPTDTSTETDACGLPDNPEGAGAPVSDGVDYYPWEGNLPRPIIAYPGCGVTARDQPVFSGRAVEGTTVSFYDNGVLIGQTLAAADDSFTWAPPVPLLGGEHSLSAVAELEGETSLPSPLLPLEVYSELPFDPICVLISYNMHGYQYTQRMRDENGCATLDGSLEMPIWVHPGTDFTISVPMRSEFLPTASAIVSEPPAAPTFPLALPSADEPDAILGTVTIHNSNPQGATSLRVASKTGVTMYSDFSTRASLDNMVISDTCTIDLPEGDYDFLFFSGTANVVDRQQRSVGGTSGWSVDIANNLQHELDIYNDSGHDFTDMYLTTNHGLDGEYIGGDFIFGTSKIKDGDNFRVKLPYQSTDATLVLKDSAGGYYIRYTKPISYPNLAWDIRFFNNPTTEVTVNYGGDKEVCYFNVLRHEDPPADKFVKATARRRAVDILELTGQAIITKGVPFTFKLESGSYYIGAYDCLGNLLGEWANTEVSGLSKTFNITTPCTPPGKLKVGEGGLQAILESVDLQCEAAVDGFAECSASSAVTASELALDLCYEPPEDTPTGWELAVGALKIDPDGYVYDADLGISTKVPEATVTCEVYDEDYQAWSEWPAAFYEEQINPQTTASDGYYAFFVPPGLYWVSASAPGYAGHTSPDIQVVDEIVHYNIPLEPTGVIPPTGKLFLPIVVR